MAVSAQRFDQPLLLLRCHAAEDRRALRCFHELRFVHTVEIESGDEQGVARESGLPGQRRDGLRVISRDHLQRDPGIAEAVERLVDVGA
jgi:hypothetical protein